MNAKENMLRTIHHNAPEWIPNGMEAVRTVRSPVVERPETAGPDAFGVIWALEAEAEGGTYPAHGGATITDFSCWREQLKLPNLDTLDWEKVRREAEAIDRDKYIVSGFVEMGLFERSYLLLGFEEALVNYLLEPEEMHEMIGVIADYKIALIERFHAEAHLDLIWYGDDWGTQNALFLPPETWCQIIRPETQRIYDCMKRLGILINQHFCGKIDAVLGDMVEMGADIWNPCQPCNDLAALKQQYGQKIYFARGIDSQFVLNCPGATPAAVDAEVKKRCIEMGQGGGYIAMPSHSVPYDPVILAAMNNAIAKYGKL